MFKGKKIIITGGTGSFGQIFVRALLKKPIAEICVFSRDEDKQEKMRHEFGNHPRLVFRIGDIRDKDSMKKAMAGVDFVIHAAALKHIPIYESQPLEVIKTNVLGAQNVVEAATEAGVKKVIGVSTDKAAEPVNVMGMTKALQEKIFVAANLHKGKKTKFSLVRYGNVLGSRGSVLPLFLRQIEQNKPLTITHPEMTRFLLTLPQAVELVFMALNRMRGGEIFIPKLPSHKVIDLAKALAELSSPVKIVQIGIRTGEKLHETLISPTESLRTYEGKSYFVILPQFDSLLPYSYYTLPKKREPFRYSSDSCLSLTSEELKEILLKEGLVKNKEKDVREKTSDRLSALLS